MRSQLHILVLVAILVSVLPAFADPLPCEPWTAVDGLGRRVAGAEACGPTRPGKFVGIFYFLWLGGHAQRGPFNITEILQQPEPQRAWGEVGTFHWWGEPRFGYYLSDDEWVIAKHAQLLADAGVDVVFFDVTNAFTYKKQYLTLCKVYRELRAMGRRTPQVSFLFNSHARRTTLQVYEDFYAKGLYPELWFQWKGKPLLLTKPEEMPQEMLDFFTIRRSWAWSRTPWFGTGENKWPWIDGTPQAYGWHEDANVPEFVPVAAASHPVNRIGRSHRDGEQPPPAEQNPLVGTYFQEQWDHALEVNPEFIFVTGWNEWVAQRFVVDHDRPFGDGKIRKGDTWFIDQYSLEYSRDVEPMRGGFEDNYYYQMVSNIRQFKGVAPQAQVVPGDQTMVVDGQADDWSEVEAEFRDDRGDIRKRRHSGYAGTGPYVNDWGRNDIVSCKVARDDTHFYFMVRTAAPLTQPEPGDRSWMNVLVNVGEKQPGFRYRIIPGEQALCAYRDGRWTKVKEIPCAVGEHVVEVAMPLGKSHATGPRELEFKWFDHVPEPFSMLDFVDHGDTAPNQRFRYFVRW